MEAVAASGGGYDGNEARAARLPLFRLRERGLGGERAAHTAAPIAHRGLHLGPENPENSLAAFRLAVEHGLPIELDVQILADGKIAVFHDIDLGRMTGQSGPVSALTSRELAALCLAGTSESIPILEDVFEAVDGKVPLLIELKSHAPRVGTLERAVHDLVVQYRGEFALQSFNWRSMAWFRRTAPSITRGQLSSGTDGVPFHYLTKPDFVAYHLGALPRKMPKPLVDQKVPLIAWTIRDVDDRAKAMKVADNFIFDASDELLAVIEAECGDVLSSGRS